MTIKTIKILLTNGLDRISFETDLPSPYEVGWAPDLRLDASPDRAIAYCQQNFPGVPVEVIDGRSEKMRFSRVCFSRE